MPSANQPQVVADFIHKFLRPPSGKTPQAIKEKLLHWVAVANDPHKYTHDNSGPRAAAELRRKARQNIRRIAARHPQVAAIMIREHDENPAEVA